MARFDHSKLYPLSGPICVEGAELGDSLLIDVMDVKNRSFGWTQISPGYGLLEKFDEYYLYKWHLDDSKFARFEKGIRIPIRRFCGVMGSRATGRGIL